MNGIHMNGIHMNGVAIGPIDFRLGALLMNKTPTLSHLPPLLP
jgi:hypothetical protein